MQKANVVIIWQNKIKTLNTIKKLPHGLSVQQVQS